MAKALIIDDEKVIRESLSERLAARGIDNITLPSGEDAVKTIRSDSSIDVVILDRKMPGMSGEETLREIKRFRPEIQVIMLTGFATNESAMESGRLDAFAYLQKPAEIEKIIEKINEAREIKSKTLEKYEIPAEHKGGVFKWLMGSHNSRPGIIILGAVLFLAAILTPASNRLTEIIGFKKAEPGKDVIVGYSDYKNMEKGQSINEYYSKKYKLEKKIEKSDGTVEKVPLSVDETVFRAKVMIGVLIVAALFWATGAIPIGFTALLVGVFMYTLGVLKPDGVAQAYLKDSVIFIFGVLAFATAITKTGLDRRIGTLLLGSSKSVPMFLFIFLPLFGVTCSFLSEHALIAFMTPILLIVYLTSVKNAGIKEDLSLAVMLFLAVNFAANCGGPGSPSAGGRNAIMMGIFTDYGKTMSYGEWVQYGLPFVPVMALVIGAYFYFAVYRKCKVKRLNVSTIVKQASEKIGPMTKKEYTTAAILVLLIVLWITASDYLGMGGPVLLCLVLLNIFRISSWRDVKKIQWEVVALYAAATAMGKGLAVTGAALYIADIFVSALPDFLANGVGLAISTSLFTGLITNLMSDGAAVSAIGPITVPMATLAGANPWSIGLATAFASSFAHILIIGTPNNAIIFAMARNPVTGEQLVKLGDFIKHGAAIFLLSLLVLWGWVILGYWRWMDIFS